MVHEHNPFPGAWKLISFQFRKEDGETLYPFGERAQGSIIYTESSRWKAPSSQTWASDQIRMFDLSGDRLPLRPPPFKLDGEQAIGILQWKRIG